MVDTVTQPIDLNQATEDELSTLPGIGLSLAQRIVTFRETVHPFEEVIELTAVPGISERMVLRFEDQVTVTRAMLDEMESAEVGNGAEPDEIESTEEDVEGVAEMESEPENIAEPDSESEVELEPETNMGADSESEVELEGDERITTDEPEEELHQDEGEVPLTPAIPEDEEIQGTDHLADATPPPRVDVESEITSRSGSLEIPEQTQATLAPVPDGDQHARRRGCIVLILGGILGALTGTFLTLAIIASLNNGALSFSQADARLGRELNDARQGQAELLNRLESIESQLEEVANRAQETAEEQTKAEQSLSAVQQDIGGLEQDISRLENADDEFEERLAGVSAAAETFEAFLDRLRDLLFDFQGPPLTPDPSPTATATPSPIPTDTPDLEEAATPEASPESTGSSTRTPRPTTTPFPIATGTPEPQP